MDVEDVAAVQEVGEVRRRREPPNPAYVRLMDWTYFYQAISARNRGRTYPYIDTQLLIRELVKE